MNKLFTNDSAIVYFPRKWDIWGCINWMVEHDIIKYGFSTKQTAFDAGLTSDWFPADFRLLSWQFRIGVYIDKRENERNQIKPVAAPINFNTIKFKTPPPSNVSKYVSLT